MLPAALWLTAGLIGAAIGLGLLSLWHAVRELRGSGLEPGE